MPCGVSVDGCCEIKCEMKIRPLVLTTVNMGNALATEATDDELDELPAWPTDPQMELRWAVDISQWEPGSDVWQFLLALLPQVESAAVARFHHRVDRKRALVSRLLQRRCVASARDIADERVVIARTKGGKPFDATPRDSNGDNFNFNVSHEGHLVVLASDPVLLVGVDVSAPFELRDGPSLGDFDTVRDTFANVLTAEEWEVVEACTCEAAQLMAFRRAWSRKESFTKARGDGLAFQLDRVEFHPCRPPRPRSLLPGDPPRVGPLRENAEDHSAQPPGGDRQLDRCAQAAPAVVGSVTAGGTQDLVATSWALLRVDGEVAWQWRCAGCELRSGHLIAVSRGPVSECIDEHGRFRATFGRPFIPQGELRARLASHPPPFQLLSIRELVPPPLRSAYDALVACRTAGVPRALLPVPPPPPPSAGFCGTTPMPAPPSAAAHDAAPDWFNPANSAGRRYDFADPFGVVDVRPARLGGRASEVNDSDCTLQ